MNATVNPYEAARERAELATRWVSAARANLDAALEERDAALEDLAKHEDKPGCPLTAEVLPMARKPAKEAA